MMFTPPHTTERIVTDDVFRPTEYDATVEFIGWESEMGNNYEGFDLIVRSTYHNKVIGLRFNNTEGTVTTKVIS